MAKYIRIKGVTPDYFVFYEKCKKNGFPCITYQKIGKQFHLVIDNSTMPIDPNTRKEELNILLHSYLIQLFEVTSLKIGDNFSFIELLISSSTPEKVAELLFNDYVNLFELL